MTAARHFSPQKVDLIGRRALPGWLAGVLGILIGISWYLATGQTPPPDADAPGAQVLTRGPVHEAFAGTITFNPEPGVVVTKAPPAVIEEVPPEERPEGDNVTWIPGYWGWDDERSDFLWVSGTWRALPPGRQWMAGYWAQTPQGYQWTSGYWADAAAREATYLPPPPATVEAGPNIAAPSVDYGWSPGCWIWYQGRYAWRPGYWAPGRVDWDWCPAHYVWSPRGYIFVGGFWDYPVARRGILFAPVYFESGVYVRRGYAYSPTIVINLGVFSDHLFVRPRYCHYYFGDYYAASYSHGGFYASFSFQSSRYGYDPIYSHQRWEHRQDREWEHHMAASYEFRRDHETARPPRTWAAQRTLNPVTAASRQNRSLVATPISQLAARKDSPLRFQPVTQNERQQLAQRGQQVQQSRDQRRTLEAKAVAPTVRTPGGTIEPAKVQLPRSPIASKPANQLGRNQSPPKAQQAPQPDLRTQPRPEPLGRQPNANRSNPQPAPRTADPEKKSTPGRSEAAAPARPVQLPAQPRANEPAARVQPAPAVPPKAQPESQPQPRANAPEARVQPAPQRNANGLEKQAPPASAQPARRRAAPGEKGASQLMKRDRERDGN